MRKLFLKPCHLLTLMTSPSSGPGKARRWRVDQITSSLWTKWRGIIAMGSTLVKYPRTSSSASKCTTAWDVSVSILTMAVMILDVYGIIMCAYNCLIYLNIEDKLHLFWLQWVSMFLLLLLVLHITNQVPPLSRWGHSYRWWHNSQDCQRCYLGCSCKVGPPGH